jgi:hypothetical protein
MKVNPDEKYTAVPADAKTTDQIRRIPNSLVCRPLETVQNTQQSIMET